MIWKGKKVLVSGSEGMIGKELVIQLTELGAKVILFDIKTGADIRDINMINEYLYDYKPEYVFHLFGIKGNPRMTNERPVDFMGPMLQGDTNMILTAQKHEVKRFLYTSSIAVENPETDKYPAWAKQTAETLIEAMRIQYPQGTKYTIVRPANVYGRYDNFDNPNAMVVTSLISKALKDNKLTIDTRGIAQVRDFINSKDVARGMIKAMEEMPENPVNLCSGKGIKIGTVVSIIADELKIPVEQFNLNIILGPDKKVMKNPYIKPQITLEEGIKEVIEYAKTNNRMSS